MATLPKNPESIDAPADLVQLLAAAGFDVVLSVGRSDGAALTDEDRALLPVLIEGHALGRELNPSDGDLTWAAAESLKADRKPNAAE